MVTVYQRQIKAQDLSVRRLHPAQSHLGRAKCPLCISYHNDNARPASAAMPMVLRANGPRIWHP